MDLIIRVICLLWLQDVINSGGLDGPHGSFKLDGESVDVMERLARATIDCLPTNTSKSNKDAYMSVVWQHLGPHDQTGMASIRTEETSIDHTSVVMVSTILESNLSKKCTHLLNYLGSAPQNDF